MDFNYSRTVELEVPTAVARIKSELANHGFGVLWELDLPAKLAEKGVHYSGEYRILEVCNPHDAKRALEANPVVGYFLPCKMVVYKEGDQTIVGMPRPTFLMGALDGGELGDLAERVEGELKSVIDSL